MIGQYLQDVLSSKMPQMFLEEGNPKQSMVILPLRPAFLYCLKKLVFFIYKYDISDLEKEYQQNLLS